MKKRFTPETKRTGRTTRKDHSRGRNDAPHLRKTLVIAGHGMVGHRFVQAAIERGLTERYDVVVVGEEPRPAYDRVALTSFFAAESADELSLLPDGEYADPRVRLVLDTPVVSIDREAQQGRPRQRRGPGLRRPRARHRCRPVRPAGSRQGPRRLLRLPHHRGPRGDPRGLEDSDRRRRDRWRAARPGGRQRPGPARPRDARRGDGPPADAGPARPGGRLRRWSATSRSSASTVHTGAATEAVLGDEAGKVTGLALKDGETVPAEVVVFSAGIRPPRPAGPRVRPGRRRARRHPGRRADAHQRPGDLRDR